MPGGGGSPSSCQVVRHHVRSVTTLQVLFFDPYIDAASAELFLLRGQLTAFGDLLLFRDVPAAPSTEFVPEDNVGEGQAHGGGVSNLFVPRKPYIS